MSTFNAAPAILFQPDTMASPLSLTVKSIDHVVFTCADVSRTIAFYELVGMRAVTFGEGRQALEFGNQKINLHQQGKELYVAGSWAGKDVR